MAITPDSGGTIRIFDEAGVERVTIGEISNDDPPDMGIVVRDPTGATEIIDGISDVPKIVASGTFTRAFGAAPGNNSVTTVVPDITTLPMIVWTVAPDTTAGTARYPGSYYSINASGTVDWSVVVDVRLTGTDLNIRMIVYSILTNPATTATARWTIFSPDGI